jgi:hypothetical protein
MKKLNIFFTVLVITALLLSHMPWSAAAAQVAPQTQTSITTFYVKQGGTGECTSWDEACELQDALDKAGLMTEIWVAKGVYVPTIETVPGDPRSVTFQLPDGVFTYGGFPDIGTPGWEDRDWVEHETVLSGDLNGNDVGFAHNAENSYHVVTNTVESPLLDGFTIKGGNADGDGVSDYHNSGGGLYNDGGSPSLTHVIFASNSAKNGGAMYNKGGSPWLENVIISGNAATDYGGGMVNEGGSPTLTNVTFSGNTAASGGGMRNVGSNPMLENITFSGNTAADNGGGMVNIDSSPTLTNVTFYDNSAGNQGGGMHNYENSSPTLRNSILWGNTPDQINNDSSSSPDVSFTIVQGDEIYPGESNLKDDPLLGPLQDNGGFSPTHALLPYSSAIDSGDAAHCPATDQRGVTRPEDGDGDGTPHCDIGAYEYQRTYATTRITSIDPEPSRVGEAFTVTVSVTSTVGVPLGEVIVTAYPSLTSCRSHLTNGETSCQLALPEIGAYTIVAGFNNSYFFYSEGIVYPHIVGADTYTTITAIEPEPSLPRQVFLVTVTVTSTLGIPQGSVHLVAEGASGCTTSITDGTGSCWMWSATRGEYLITATYDNAFYFYVPSSDTITHTVDGYETLTTLVAEPSPSQVGQPVTFTAQVSLADNYSAFPSGGVIFTIDGTDLPPISLEGDAKSTYTTSSLAAGAHTVSARYLGSPEHYPSSTGQITHNVLPTPEDTSEVFLPLIKK